VSAYVYNPGRAALSFREARDRFVAAFPRVVTGAIDNVSAQRVENVLADARAAGIPFESVSIDIDGYRRYYDQAGYATRYPSYYRGNQPEKSLEHWTALSLLEIQPTEVFVDIASENSPVPEIYWRLAGASSFGQDIMNAPGIAGNTIGGDACAMPVPDGFIAKAALTCSLEHFEQDADIRLFAELARVLRPAGRVVVVPFYVYEEDATQTDPQVSLAADVPFDDDTVIYCAEGWGNRHGRFYRPSTFKRKIADRFADAFEFRYLHLANAGAVHPSVYARFALLAVRR
jgi:SAM-dependent methyltransferase